MKTQLLVTVIKEKGLSRSLHWGTLWKRNESHVLVYIDSENAEPMELAPRKMPYAIDLEPGEHIILFKDSDTSIKKIFSGSLKLGAAIGVGAFSLGAGGSFLSSVGDTLLATGGAKIKDDMLQCNLREGDVLKISCQPTMKGTIKVKMLK